MPLYYPSNSQTVALPFFHIEDSKSSVVIIIRAVAVSEYTLHVVSFHCGCGNATEAVFHDSD